MRSNVAYLISFAYQQDAYGVLQRTLEKRKVMVDVSSVSASEFFEGGRNGLKPALRFTLFAYDYGGENIIEYNGEQYTVYRTYLRNYDKVE